MIQTAPQRSVAARTGAARQTWARENILPRRASPLRASAASAVWLAARRGKILQSVRVT